MTYRITHLDAAGLRVCANQEPIDTLAEALERARCIPTNREPRIMDDTRVLTLERAEELLSE